MNFSVLKLSIPQQVIAFLFFGMLFSTELQAKSTTLTLVPDSVGTEIINGEVYIIHKVVRNDTYYQLGRQYNVPVKTVMDANNKKNLKLGDTVKVPTGRKATSTAPVLINPNQASKPAQEIRPQDIFTEYKVSKSETLYSIAKKFGTNVPDLKRANNLTSDSLRDGMLLKIPNGNIPEPEPEPIEIIPLPVPIEQPTVDLSGFEANKYGIREKKEKGVGIWMDNLESDGKSNLALHKSAPIGTILKITNPITNNVTYAKVVGKFSDNVDTQDAIVVLSKSAASYIGVHDRRFLVEITYGVPLNFE
ncbi:DPBB and LysM peptidoglycan-binding domain-containing protein [Sphingobacterium hungaricum]